MKVIVLRIIFINNYHLNYDAHKQNQVEVKVDFCKTKSKILMAVVVNDVFCQQQPFCSDLAVEFYLHFETVVFR